MAFVHSICKHLYARNWWSGYVVACVATFVSLLARLLFMTDLPFDVPFLLFYPSLTVAAFYGGGKPGLLATALGAIAAIYFMEPGHSLLAATRENWVMVSVFLLEGAFISSLGGALHLTLKRLDTQREQLEIEVAERKKAQAILDRAGRRKDEFLATLAHELRNPLAPISNALDILRKTTDDILRERVIGIIERQVRQMTHLVDDLMDVERIARDKIVLRKEPVLLSNAISNAIESVKPLIAEKNHELSVCLPASPVWLEGDMTRLTQIFANVLNNAAKYTNPGGTIRLDAAAEDGEAKVVISDDGIGIPPELLPRIFDMFTQGDGKSDRSQKGIGIGLALVRKLVQLHGGSISARSDGPGKGSRFRIRLPTIESAGAVVAAPEAPHAPSDAPDHRRVLVVDDSIDSAQTLAWMMEPLGYEVKIARDGPTGIETAKSFLPDIILLDIGMPMMDGYDACAALRRLPELKDTIIIAQTGYGQREDRQRSMDAGFDAHVVKPVSMAEVQKIIHERRAEGERAAPGFIPHPPAHLHSGHPGERA